MSSRGSREEIERTRQGLCARCAEPVGKHPGGNCPDGGGSYTWAVENPRQLIRNLEAALEFAARQDWWKKIVVQPLAMDKVLAFLGEYSRDLGPDVVAERAWGAEFAHSEQGCFFWELLADVSMVFAGLSGALWFLSGGRMYCHQDELQDCGGFCTCPRYPCPCDYDPYRIAAQKLQFADHYLDSALQRLGRVLPR